MPEYPQKKNLSPDINDRNMKHERAVFSKVNSQYLCELECHSAASRLFNVFSKNNQRRAHLSFIKKAESSVENYIYNLSKSFNYLYPTLMDWIEQFIFPYNGIGYNITPSGGIIYIIYNSHLGPIIDSNDVDEAIKYYENNSIKNYQISKALKIEDIYSIRNPEAIKNYETLKYIFIFDLKFLYNFLNFTTNCTGIYRKYNTSIYSDNSENPYHNKDNIKLLFRANGNIFNYIFFRKTGYISLDNRKQKEVIKTLKRINRDRKNLSYIYTMYKQGLDQEKFDDDTLKHNLFPESPEEFLKSINYDETESKNLLKVVNYIKNLAIQAAHIDETDPNKIEENILEIEENILSLIYESWRRNLYFWPFNICPISKEDLCYMIAFHRENALKSNKIIPNSIIPYNDNSVYINKTILATLVCFICKKSFEKIAQNDSISNLTADIYSRFGVMPPNDKLTPDIYSPVNFKAYVRNVLCEHYFKSNNRYKFIRTILGHITNNEIVSLKELLVVIVRAFLGKSLFEDVANTDYLLDDYDNTVANVVILCTNPLFIKNFLDDLFQNLTVKHSFSELENSQKYTAFQKDEIDGKCINLSIISDHNKPSSSNNLNKLFRGTKVYYKDRYMGAIPYQNSFFHIFTAKQLPSGIGMKNMKFNLLKLNGQFTDLLYETPDTQNRLNQISQEEKTMLLSAALLWIMGTLKIKVTQQKKAPLDGPAAFDLFIEKFGIITIPSAMDLDQYRSEKYQTMDNKSKLSEAKNLGITNLDFERRDDVYSAFTDWYDKLYGTLTNFSDADMTSIMNSKKLTFLHYIKKSRPKIQYQGNKNGSSGDARGWYGLHLDYKQIEKEISQDSPQQDDTEQKQALFDQFFDQIMLQTENILSMIFKSI